MSAGAKVPKDHQTTVRFSSEMWEELIAAAGALDVSVAQYLRDAARLRLEGSDVNHGSHVRDVAARAQDVSLDQAENSAALWEQGRLARQRARELRDQAQAQRGAHTSARRRSPDMGAVWGRWQRAPLAQERAGLSEDGERDSKRRR